MGKWSNSPGPADPVKVERAVDGRGDGPLNTAERAEAVRELTRRGWSDAEIARHLGFADRSVSRIRAREAIPPARESGSGRRLHHRVVA